LTGIILVAVSCGLLAYYLWPRPQVPLKATIYHQSALLYDIDLAKEDAERDILLSYPEDTSKTDMTVAVRKNAICVKESGCPNQFCVREGWVSEANRSIICAYNEVYIFLEGTSDIDVYV
jgi:hypothetical protein